MPEHSRRQWRPDSGAVSGLELGRQLQPASSAWDLGMRFRLRQRRPATAADRLCEAGERPDGYYLLLFSLVSAIQWHGMPRCTSQVWKLLDGPVPFMEPGPRRCRLPGVDRRARPTAWASRSADHSHHPLSIYRDAHRCHHSFWVIRRRFCYKNDVDIDQLLGSQHQHARGISDQLFRSR